MPQAPTPPNFTSRDRTLPDFIVVGAAKSGTKAIRVNLGRHPDVFMAGNDRTPSEPHFFNKHWNLGLAWYQKWFTEPNKLQGEKTPDYLPVIACHERMASIVPHAKLVITLRNPVDRAYSAWNHHNQIIDQSKFWGWEVMPFADAIRTDNRAMRPLIEQGRYINHIRHLLRFYPRAQIHIMIAERLRANRAEEYSRLLEFLGLGPSPSSFKDEHIRQYAEPIDSVLREKLADYFAPTNAELAKFLGDKIPEWR